MRREFLDQADQHGADLVEAPAQSFEAVPMEVQEPLSDGNGNLVGIERHLRLEEAPAVLVELADDRGRSGLSVELLLELGLQEAALFLHDHDLLEAVGKTRGARGFQGPGHADLVDAEPELACLLPRPGGALCGTRDGRLLRLHEGQWVPVESFDAVEGQETWHAVGSSVPYVRSLTATSDDGALLVIFDGLGLAKLARDSTTLWTFPAAAHHDLDVRPDGSIFVLVRERRELAGAEGARIIAEDFVVELDPEGRERRRVSLYDAVARSNFSLWLRDARRIGDEHDLANLCADELVR